MAPGHPGVTPAAGPHLRRLSRPGGPDLTGPAGDRPRLHSRRPAVATPPPTDQCGSVHDALLDLATGAACLVCGRPGRALCPACDIDLGAGSWPTRPRPCPAGLLPVFTAGGYEGALRTLLLAHKERGLHGLSRPLGRLLAHVVLGALPADPRRGSPVVLVPVSSHPAVVRARGHDPVLSLARRATHEVRRRGRPATVRRPLRVVGRPRDQAGLGAAQRQANLEDRFCCRAAVGHELEDACVVLVDDVVTTGATLREAQRALEAGGWTPRVAVTLAATRRRQGVPDSAAGG